MSDPIAKKMKKRDCGIGIVMPLKNIENKRILNKLFCKPSFNHPVLILTFSW